MSAPRFDRHRDPGRARQDGRRPPAPRPGDWVAVLEEAERFGREAEGGEVGGDPLALMRFRERVRELTADSFPPPAETARLIAGAFLNVARAFAHAATAPEARTACAPLLRAAARHADEIFALHRARLAQGTWGRQFGDDA